MVVAVSFNVPIGKVVVPVTGVVILDAVRKAVTTAKKELEEINLKGTTVPHEVIAKFGASKVMTVSYTHLTLPTKRIV
mgnify:CR=1 FL=1